MTLGRYVLLVTRGEGVRLAISLQQTNPSLATAAPRWRQKWFGRLVFHLTSWPGQKGWIADAIWYRK